MMCTFVPASGGFGWLGDHKGSPLRVLIWGNPTCALGIPRSLAALVRAPFAGRKGHQAPFVPRIGVRGRPRTFPPRAVETGAVGLAGWATTRVRPYGF